MFFSSSSLCATYSLAFSPEFNRIPFSSPSRIIVLPNMVHQRLNIRLAKWPSGGWVDVRHQPNTGPHPLVGVRLAALRCSEAIRKGLTKSRTGSGGPAHLFSSTQTRAKVRGSKVKQVGKSSQKNKNPPALFPRLSVTFFAGRGINAGAERGGRGEDHVSLLSTVSLIPLAHSSSSAHIWDAQYSASGAGRFPGTEVCKRRAREKRGGRKGCVRGFWVGLRPGQLKKKNRFGGQRSRVQRKRGGFRPNSHSKHDADPGMHGMTTCKVFLHLPVHPQRHSG